MRNRTLVTLGAVALALATIPATAQGPGWTVNSTVMKLVVTSNGGINVRLSPDLTGCVAQSGYGSVYASIPPTHPGIDRMKADLLTAYVTQGIVALYLVDGNCYVGELELGGR